MLELGPLYEEHIQPFITSTSPTIPFYSSVTGQKLDGDECLGAKYWRKNMESPVLFNTALRSALQDFDSEKLLLVEIGPHPALKGPVGQILRDLDRSDNVTHFNTLQRNLDCHESLLHLAGKLYQDTVQLRIPALFPGGNHVSNLPRYGWKHSTNHWAESRLAHEYRFRKHPPHDLLGAREASSEPCWRHKLALEDVPWLAGHQVNGQIVYPAAAYISMIGEAVRQLDNEDNNEGEDEGERTFSLKDVSITTGLILDRDKTAELVTRLTPLAQDSSDDTPWYGFSICSHDGTRWVKHCSGEARASVDMAVSLDDPKQEKNHSQLPRDVDENEWYKVLSRVGFNYTGVFRGLHNVSAATTQNQSVASISSTQTDEDDGKYTLHPGTIDQCFQLFTVSAYRGLGRNCTNIAVPTFIKEIVVSPASSQTLLDVAASISTQERGSFVGDLQACANGRVLLSLKGFKASAMSSGGDLDAKAPLVTGIHWRPHVEFLALGELMYPREHCPEEIPMLEQLMVLCVQDHVENIKVTDETAPHLVKLFGWMRQLLERYRAGVCPSVFKGKGDDIWELDTAQRLLLIENLVSRINKTIYSPMSTAIHTLFKEASSIFTGETHPLHVLLKDDVLANFYSVGDSLSYHDAIQAMAHSNPKLRVLEVGAGTGGTTAKVLKALKTDGQVLYSSYTYTDISTGFMDTAKKRFCDAENMTFAALDVAKDPLEQGFTQGGYDLIIGSNVSILPTASYIMMLLNNMSN